MVNKNNRRDTNNGINNKLNPTYTKFGEKLIKESFGKDIDAINGMKGSYNNKEFNSKNPCSSTTSSSKTKKDTSKRGNFSKLGEFSIR